MSTTETGLDLSAVGKSTEPREYRWTSRDALIYAVGVGAGQEDPGAELAYTTENSQGVEQQVLPTFGVLMGMGGLPPVGKIKLSQILHAEQGITLHRPLPVDGTVSIVSSVTGIFDKGKGALINTSSEVTLDGEPLATTTSGIFVRGAGGFGGDRGPAGDWTAPEGEPDAKVTYQTGIGQALVYRLSGDRNPLHSDPEMAKSVGFPGPILHGLCTYGFTGRALLAECCGGESARFGSMNARFSMPVMPGQALTISIWKTDGGAQFTTATDAGTVLDRGTFTTA